MHSQRIINGPAVSRIFQYKLVLLGESAVGKSSLVLRFVKGQFHDYQESTIGGAVFLSCCFCLSMFYVMFYINMIYSFTAAFLTQSVCLEDATIKFEIWDTAGQERYHSLAPMYYRGAHVAIVVYDVTSQVKL